MGGDLHIPREGVPREFLESRLGWAQSTGKRLMGTFQSVTLYCLSYHSSIQILKIASLTAHTRMYPEVSGLAAWNENCKWYSSLPLNAVVSLFCESVE
jgi:hypothetical protein